MRSNAEGGSRWSTSKAVGIIKVCLILVSMTFPLGWMGWTSWRQAQLGGNERAASNMLRLFCVLEAEVRAKDLDGNGVADFWTGDAPGRLALAPANWPTAHGLSAESVIALSQADPSRPGARPYRGYWFTAILVDENGKPYRLNGGNAHPSTFGWCAYPARYGIDGHGTFIINEGNCLFKRTTNGTPVPSWPAEQDLKQSWGKVC